MGLICGKNDVHATEEYFNGKVVWVTGASGGLGEALSVTLCRIARPKALILSARRAAELSRVQKQCQELRPDVQVKVLPLDLNDITGLKSASQQALQFCGQVDVLINNGGQGFRDLAINTSIDVDRMVMNVNYFSGVALVKALLPGWMERSAGHVVQISSVQGFFGLPGRTAYAASKHASHGFYDSLRSEVADSGISVTIVAPGYIKTDFSNNAARGSGETYPEGHADRGLPPEVCALQILGGTAKHCQEIVPAELNARLARYLRTLCPSVLFWYMRRRARKERHVLSQGAE